MAGVILCSALWDPAIAASKAVVADPAESAYLTRAFIFVDAPQIATYLGSVSRRLLDSSAISIPLPNILIYSSDAFDFFTDSKRNLIVSTGALRILSSEDELAAVLSHELSHLILRHPQNKDAMRAFPIGVETLSYVAVAADRLHGSGSPNFSNNLTKFGDNNLADTQAVSLIWSDIIAPSWNRKQERAADASGYDLMSAAGYDTSAFGTLFQKLHAAENRRSERMLLLRKVMLAKLAQKPEVTSSEFDAFVAKLKGKMKESVVNLVTERLSSFNRDYDSPDVRQQALAKHAQAHRVKGKRAPHPASNFAKTIKQGSGSSLLSLDDAAIRTLDALSAKDVSKARATAQRLLAASVGGNPPAAHLNLALGVWYQANGRADLAEQRARAWLSGQRPPAQAYVWVAYYEATRNQLTRAITTLERGRHRVGNASPFLPHLITLARTSGQQQLAERYTQECKEEDRKNSSSVVTAFFEGNQVPSGLYADCVQRLGHMPSDENALVHAVKNPVEATKGFASRLRDKFRRKPATAQ
jgi:Zn-dependent protease with chaperone function